MQGRTVARSSITSNRKRRTITPWAAIYDSLLDLKMDQAREIATTNETHSTNIRYRLRKIANKEGTTIGWDRNADHTLLYLWIETGASK